MNISETIILRPYEEISYMLNNACGKDPSYVKLEKYTKDMTDMALPLPESGGESDKAIRDSITLAIKQVSSDKFMLHPFEVAAINYPKLFTLTFLLKVYDIMNQEKNFGSCKITKSELMEEYLKSLGHIGKQLDEYLSGELYYTKIKNPEEECRGINDDKYRSICKAMIYEMERLLEDIVKNAANKMFIEFAKCANEVKNLIDNDFYSYDPAEIIATEL